jgi:NADPH:quinone reductase-like Zn-dependent oxidoreductase
MQRIQYHQYGGPGAMRLEDFKLPALKKGEVVVGVNAASINPIDWKLRQGFMKLFMGRKFPRGMGIDLAGIVEAVGPGVTELSPGDEVMGWAPMMSPGAFAEAVVTKAALLIIKPKKLSLIDAAALPTVGVTAWRALVDAAKLKQGQSVFINGASGGVGQAAIAIARAHGSSITVRVGPSWANEEQAFKPARVLDYNQPISSGFDGSFDVVMDCHGGLTPKEEERLIKRSGVAVDIDPKVGNMFRSLISRKHRMVRGMPSQEILRKVADLAAAGQFPLTISRTAPLSGAIR